MPWLERVVIIALDPTDRFGLAPDWIWEWVDGQRQVPPKTARAIISESLSHHRISPKPDSKVSEAAEV
jgi:hypothetical protein